MAQTLKKTVTHIGTTSNPSLWTYKQVIYDYWEDDYLLTNKSTVKVETYLGRAANSGSAQSYGGNANTSIKVDSETKSQPITPIYGDVWISAGGWSSKPLVTQTFTVKHGSDGTKTINVNSSLSTSSFSPNSASATGSVTLTTIPRGSEFADGTGMPVNGSNIDNGIIVRINKHVDTFYDRLVIKHYNTNQQLTTLKTIDNIIDNTSVTFTSTELDALYSASIPSSVVGLFLYLYSYTDNTYTTLVNEEPREWLARGVLNIVIPTFSNFEYSDVNASTYGLTKDNSYIVGNYSMLRISIPTNMKATANTRQTAMSHYIIDGQTVAYSNNATVTKDFGGYSKDNISVYAVDQRSTASSIVNKSFTSLGKYINYTNIVKNDNQSYSRSDSGVGEFVTLTFSGSWWGNKLFGGHTGAVRNSLSATYKYRISGTQAWTVPTNPSLELTLEKAQTSDEYYTRFSFNNIVKGDLSTNGFNIGNSYDIMVTVSDALSSVEYNFSIHSGEPAIALYKNKAALGGAYDELLGGTQLWGNTYLNGNLLTDIIYPVGSIYLTVDGMANPNTLFANTTWVRIKDTFLLASGDTYANGSTGGEAEVTLTIDEMPSHSHDINNTNANGYDTAHLPVDFNNTKKGYGNNVYTNHTGGGQPHNNMPPYLAVCVWKRTA